MKKLKNKRNTPYRLQFIGSARFMASPLLNLVNNFTQGTHIITCKYGDDNKKFENCGIKYKDCQCFLESKKIILR